jgi:hypothetical protein
MNLRPGHIRGIISALARLYRLLSVTGGDPKHHILRITIPLLAFVRLNALQNTVILLS